MKTLIAIAAATAVLGAAGTSLAEDSQGLTVGGSAEAFCTLPTIWSFVSGNAGASSSQFVGGTWTIPEAAMANNGSASDGYAIRVRGTGHCNASHSISVTSLRGGLVAGPPGAPAPAGFANRRPLYYEAFWSNGAAGGSAQPFGPSVVLDSASVPGQTASVNYTIGGNASGPPGNRAFDVKISLRRPALGVPLIAGDYSDTLIVTIAAES